MPSFTLMKSTATFISDYDDMTWLMMVAMTRNAPLLIIGFPCFGSFSKKMSHRPDVCLLLEEI